MYGGPLHRHEFENLRNTTTFIAKLEAEGFSTLPKDSWRNLSVHEDPYDWELFKAARKIFVHNLQEYGLVVPPQLLRELKEDTPGFSLETLAAARALEPDYLNLDALLASAEKSDTVEDAAGTSFMANPAPAVLKDILDDDDGGEGEGAPGFLPPVHSDDDDDEQEEGDGDEG
jgi:hypothetical protein